MRTMLLEWLCEVSTYMGLFRRTYHMAVDFVDRVLLRTENFPVNQFQLLGISCLFIAIKLEVSKIKQGCQATSCVTRSVFFRGVL